MTRFINTIFVLLGLLLTVEGLVPSLAAKETKRVLILYGQEKGHPAHNLTEQGLHAAFQTTPSVDIQLYTEYLDVGRFPGPRHSATVSDFLRHKYSGMEIDAIIAVYPYAADFLLANRLTLFPGVPIIASEVTRSYAEKMEHSPVRRFMTGTILGDNIAGVMAAALRMRPATKRVALVAGTTPNDAYSEQIFRKGLGPYAGRIEVIDLTRLSMEETLSRVSSLPPDTLILYSSMFRDGSGKSFVPREALSLIARAANAPVFGLYETFLGHGIVGGRLVSFEQHGREAAALALRILSGESPAAIPFGGEQAYVSLYDWRELKRWHIPEAAVPAGSVVLYKRPSLLEEHRWSIGGGLILIVAEGFLILVLVINLRRRRKAEQALSKSKQDLHGLTARLIDTQEEELSHLSRELHDDLTQRLAGLAIDAGMIEQQLKSLQVPAAQELNDMKMKLIGVSEDVHNLSRQLHPAILDDLGLVEAVKSECMVFSRRTGIALSFEPNNVPGAIPKDIALCLYRVIQEGLKNIEKHAKITQAQISLQGFSGSIRLLIQDVGAGFDPHTMKNKAGLGLSSIRERVGFINGTMSVKSEQGKGTEIEVFVPLEGRA
jgi:signal transduction histidine kinase